jgi:hypothetical protein
MQDTTRRHLYNYILSLFKKVVNPKILKIFTHNKQIKQNCGKMVSSKSKLNLKILMSKDENRVNLTIN